LSVVLVVSIALVTPARLFVLTDPSSDDDCSAESSALALADAVTDPSNEVVVSLAVNGDVVDAESDAASNESVESALAETVAALAEIVAASVADESLALPEVVAVLSATSAFVVESVESALVRVVVVVRLSVAASMLSVVSADILLVPNALIRSLLSNEVVGSTETSGVVDAASIVA
jgi:hypothetical protein